MEPGYMALSIYCAHMSSKWSCILDSRPIQGKDMSVEVYYDQFCIWKKKLEEVNYIGEEESYIDDFLYGLKMDLAVRVWVYKWKPRTLYGAFRRAEMEETMLSWKELSRKNDVDKVFEEMSQPNFINIADTVGAEGVSDEKTNDVLGASGFVATKEAVMMQTLVDSQGETTPKQDAGDLAKKVIKMLDKLTEPNDKLTEPNQNEVSSFPLKSGVVKVAYHMLDEMLGPILIKHNNENVRHEELVLPNIGLLKIMSSVEAAPKLPSLMIEGSKNAQHVFGKIPSNISLSVCWPRWLENEDKAKEESSGTTLTQSTSEEVSTLIATENLELDVELWFGKMLIFVFDPGLCAISVHILEDKDVFKRVGKRIIPMDITLVIMGRSKWDTNGMFDNTTIVWNPDWCFWCLMFFVWNPGGSSLFHSGCDSSDYTYDKQHFDKFSGNKVGSVLAIDCVLPKIDFDFLMVPIYLVRGNLLLTEPSFTLIDSDRSRQNLLFSIGIWVFEANVLYEKKWKSRSCIIWLILIHQCEKKVNDEGNGHVAACKIKNPTMMGLGMSRRVIVIEPNLMVCRLILKWVDHACCWRLFGDFLFRLGTTSTLPQGVHHTGNELGGPNQMKLVLKLSTIFYTTVYATTNFGFLLLVDYILGSTPAIFGAIIGVTHSISFDDIVVRYGRAQELTSKLLIFLFPPWNIHTIDMTELYACWVRFCWGQFSTVLLAWYTQIAEYIAWEVKKEAQHYTNATMDKGILLKHLVNREQERICVVKLLDHLKHEDILFIFMIDPSKFPRKSGVLMLLLYFADAMTIFVLAILKNFCMGSQSRLGLSFHHLEDKAVVEGKDLSCPEVEN